MKSYMMLVKWVLVVGGLLRAYEGLTKTDLILTTVGSNLAPMVNIVVFGGSAVLLAYHLLTMKKKK